MITRLWMLTVETGLICTLSILISLILFVVAPQPTWYLLPGITHSMLYTISLMAVRNFQYPASDERILTI